MKRNSAVLTASIFLSLSFMINTDAPALESNEATVTITKENYTATATATPKIINYNLLKYKGLIF